MSLAHSIKHTFKARTAELFGKILALGGGLLLAAGLLLFLGPQKLFGVGLLLTGLVIGGLGAGLVNYGKKNQKKSVQTNRY